MELIRRFTPEQYASGLEDWRFLGLEGKRPSFSSPFGDVFFESPDGWWFLDIVGGTLTREWATPEELQAAMNTREGRNHFLMAELAEVADRNGLQPSETQVLSFVVPPALGGQVDPENLEVSDMVVSLSFAGQICEQTRDLPGGTPVTGVSGM